MSQFEELITKTKEQVFTAEFPVIDGDDREDELGEFYVLPINN